MGQPARAVNLTGGIGQRRGTPSATLMADGEQGEKACPDPGRESGGGTAASQMRHHCETGMGGLMKHGASRELYAYWNRVRGGDRAPHRGAIEPSDIRRVLADTFILEVVDRETHLVRLAGTRVCSIYCRELKSTNFFDLWRADDRSAISTLAAAVSEDGAAAVVTIEARTARDQDVTAELLLLPLRNSGPAFDRVLGSLAVLERPYWLGTEPVARQTIASLRLIWPDETPPFMRRRTDTPGARSLTQMPPPAPIPFPARNSRRRGHLFVVDGGKE